MELLGYIIEFSIGLAGFASVIAVFSQRSDVTLELDKWRLLNLVMSTIGPAFLSFTALGLVSWLGEVTRVWQVSSGLLACYVSIIVIVAATGRSRLPTAQRELVNNRVFPFGVGFLLITGFVQVLSAATIVVPAFEWFYLGLISILLLGVYVFVQSVLGGMRPSIEV